MSATTLARLVRDDLVRYGNAVADRDNDRAEAIRTRMMQALAELAALRKAGAL